MAKLHNDSYVLQFTIHIFPKQLLQLKKNAKLFTPSNRKGLYQYYIDGLVQERCNSSALAM